MQKTFLRSVFISLLVSLAVVWVLAVDSDNDGMSDAYELFFGLNVNSNDAALNYDDDTLSNYEESLLWSDPHVSDTDRDLWPDCQDNAPVSRAFVPWGNPQFTSTNNMVTYTWPSWMISAWAVDGAWTTNMPFDWHSSYADGSNVGWLNMDVDRSLVTSNLVMKLDFFDHTNSSMFIDLYDTNEVITATNLYGNLNTGAATNLSRTIEIPFADYPSAVGIHIRKGEGAMTIYRSLLYIDADLDGLDAEQEAQLGTSDQNADSDGDGISDYEEVFASATDPCVFNMTLENLTGVVLQRWMNVGGSQVSNLTVDPRYPCHPDQETELTAFFEAPVNVANYFGHRIVGRFLAPRTGDYTFWLASDDNGELWITKGTNRQLIASVASYTASRQWTKYASQKSAAIHLEEGQRYLIEALGKEQGGGDNLAVGIQFPGGLLQRPASARWFQTTPAGMNIFADADADGLTDYEEWVLGTSSDSQDTDGDFKSDYDEAVYGTDPLVADDDNDGMPMLWELQYGLNLCIDDSSFDLDGDGLSNIEEYRLGSNPQLYDTDGDGIGDGLEVNLFFSDPLVADVPSPSVWTQLAFFNGDQFSVSLGEWVKDPPAVYSVARGGYVGYEINVPSDGYFAVELVVAEHNPLMNGSKFDITLSVDGREAQRQVISIDGGTGTGFFLTPWLTSGQHTARVLWNDFTECSVLKILQVKVSDLGGDDADQSGRPDWMDNRIRRTSSVSTGMVTSIVSPICLEGTSMELSILEVSASYAPEGMETQDITAHHALGSGWYADVLLSPTNATVITVSEQQGVLSKDQAVTWVPVNVMDGIYTNVLLREGSAMLLTGFPTNVMEGTVSLTVSMGTNVMTNVVTDVVHPFEYWFEADGDYTVDGSFSNSIVQTNASMLVSVRGGGFPSDDPVVFVSGSRFRKWDCPSMPVEATIEYDDDLQVTIEQIEGGGSKLNIKAAAADDRYIVARLGENGPILDSAKVNCVKGDFAGKYWIEKSSMLDDSTVIITMRINVGPIVPDNLVIYMHTYSAGAAFDDGTRFKIITAADFNELGEYTYNIIKGYTRGACHYIEVFDNDVRIAFR